VPDIANEEEFGAYIQRGLKKIKHVETGWFVDPRFYNRDTVKVDFTNGLLTIRIYPKDDVRPKKVHLFGTHQDQKTIEEKKE